MKLSFPPAISEALQLTRAGNLKEATAVIQAALSSAKTSEPQSQGPAPRAGEGLPLLNSDVVALQASPDTGKVGIEATRTFEERTYYASTKQLAYHLYKPSGAHAGMPLVIMLHGCTQSPEDFARGTGMNKLADEMGFLVAYPRQTAAANAQKCWNWFRPDDQKRDRGEPALIAGITRQIISDEQADPERVYVAGLSAGGAAAAIMSSAYPDIYAAAGIHSGLPCGGARDVTTALMAMRNGSGRTIAATPFVPVITFHGDRDTTVAEVNSAEIVAAASSAATKPLRKSVETGTHANRKYSRETASDSSGHILIERWTVHGGGHAWSGGDRSGSYADPAGPDASREMLRFFLTHRLPH